ncbi:MAG: ParB N-terminal domain-containing protein [Pyrinomonadaceae bacterium]
MQKARDRVLRTQWLAVSRLVVAQYYGELFPLPRDWRWLRQSFEQHGYRPEYPIVARIKGDDTDTFEIVCGVGRYTVAKERGMRRVPAIIRRFEDSIQAKAYAIEDNLYNPATSSARISIVHAISLARVLKDCGVAYSAQRIWESARVSESTFWRAVSSFDSTLQKITRNHPEIAALRFSQQVSEIVRRDLCPQFTKLLAGEIEVHTYHKSHRQVSTTSMHKTSKADVKSRSSAKKRKASYLHGSAAKTAHATSPDRTLSNKSTHQTSPTTKTSRHKKRTDKEREPSLFDL